MCDCQISYNFKLRLDISGNVINSHCECPAGKGPHGTCKHVAAVLLMLTVFAEDGKLSVKHNCTEKLQTFHKPKRRHDGNTSLCVRLLNAVFPFLAGPLFP